MDSNTVVAIGIVCLSAVFWLPMLLAGIVDIVKAWKEK